MAARAAIGMLFVAVILAAAARGVPDVVDRPLLAGARGAPEAIPLPATASTGALVERGLTLHAADAAGLAAFDEIWLVVGTYDTAPALESGTLAIAGGCVFRAGAGGMADNTTLHFRRDAPCGALAHAPADVALALTFKAASPRDARAAIWMLADRGGPPLLEGRIEGRAAPLLGRAILHRGTARPPRAELLAFMWALPEWAFWLLLAAGSGLAAAGGLFLARSSPRAAAFGSFALACGLALVYAVMVPPLQAPDEPDHLLSFAALTERPALAEATSNWARRIHFERLAFNPDERFTPADRDRPLDRAWDPAEVFAENVRHRSSATTRSWQVLAPLTPGNPAHALLFLRCADAVMFGAAFAAGAALVAAAGAGAPAGLLAAVLLAIPTLPFFGMHLSELTLTIVAFVAAGYGAVLLLDGAPGRASGPLFGVAVALIAAGPRSGWPSLATIGALAAARALNVPTATSWRDTWGFWGGFAVPGVVLFTTGVLWIPSPFYEQWRLAEFDPRAGISSTTFVLALSAAACAGALAERLAAAAAPAVRALGLFARACAGLGALFVAATLAWSAWLSLPRLETVEVLPPASASAYVRAVLVTLATWPRVRGFDFLTWTSLWGGFGWADTILPAAVISIVTVLAAAASIATLSGAARGSGRATVILAGAAGLAACAAVAALSSYGLHRNVHGRYLLGSCVIALCLLVAPVVLAPGRRLSASARATALLALCCALHAFALNFLLGRYFG